MARPANLKRRTLALLLGLVLVLHFVGLEWFARERDQVTLLRTMAPPMYTRMLKPSAPPPVVAQAAPAAAPKPRPAARAAPRPRPKASEPVPPAEPAQPEPPVEPLAQAQAQPEPAPEPPPTEPEGPVAQAPEPAASAAAAAAPAPAASAPAGEALASWPTDTRLTYRLSGQFRGGPLYGDARVQWQRDGDKYQVRLDVDIKYFTEFTMTSQGDVTPGGLLPRAYEEYRPGKRRGAKFGDELLTLENGRSAARPPGLQDTASQFVELAHRFATGRELLEVGRTITFPMARPSNVDVWTYDIVGRELLRTPKLGTVEAFHLKPRPIANPRGNITAEMWFAPSLQYLPVRIKVFMGEEAHLDLLVEHIEQK